MMTVQTKILVFLLLLLTFVSCEKKQNQESAQTLHLNLSEDPVSLDPRVVRSLKDLTVVKQLFEGLTRMDRNNQPQLALAEKVDVSEDLLTYTFTLREAFWSNKNPVTAHDFEYAWTKVLDPSFASDYSYMLYPIKNAKLSREGKCSTEAIGVAALDDRTLVVQLETPTPYFLELTAFPTYFPINHKIDVQLNTWSCPPGDRFVCNGPFCLKKWDIQRELTLEKNPTYWDCDEVHLDKIVFSVISDNNTESQLFEKNELDWLGQPISNSIATEILGKMKEAGKLDSYMIAGTFWLKFNTEKEPFNHPKVRKAFSYVINRQEIITHILQGNQVVATTPIPPSMALNKTPYFQDGDIELARQLLKEAMEENGWTQESFPKIVLSYPPSERNIKMIQLIQEQWRKAFDLNIELAAIERQVYRRNVKQGFYQVGTGDWVADFNDPIAFLELFKYRNDADTGSGMNDTRWQNETFIALLDESIKEKDKEERAKLLLEAEGILVEEMPIAPLYHYSFDYIKKPYLQEVILSPLGSADFKTAKIEFMHR